MERFRVLTVVILALLIMGLGLFLAADIQAQENPSSIAKMSLGLPDLLIYSVIIDPIRPEIGKPINKISIEVKNQGTADAAANELKLTCIANACVDETACKQLSQALTSVTKVPAIKKGGSVILEWVPPVPVKWVQGKFAIAATVDYTNMVQELDETNNTRHLAISVTGYTPKAAVGKSDIAVEK